MRKLLVVAAAGVVLLSSVTQAQELPTPAELKSRATSSLPPFWDVGEFRLVATARSGDVVSPVAQIRFEADALPAKDLFTPTGEEVGPFQVVAKTYPHGQARTLYGTMELSYSAGTWKGTPNIENPVDQLGRPLDLFTSPTIELGSAAQEQILAQIRANAVAKAEGELAAILAQLEATQRARVAETKAKNEADLDRRATAHAARLAKLQEQYQAETTQLEEKVKKAGAAYQDRLSKEHAKAQEAHEAELAKLDEELKKAKAAQEAELQRLSEAHAAAVGALRVRQKQEISEIETGFETEKGKIARKMAAADDVIAKQNELIEKQQTIADNTLWLQNLQQTTVQSRNEFLDGLVGIWEGVAVCHDEAAAVQLTVEKRSGLAIIGPVKSSRRDKEVMVNLTMKSDKPEFPVQFYMTSTEQLTKSWASKEYAVSMDASGVFSGKSIADEGCTIRFGR